MNIINGTLRNKLRERPFDFYVAFVLFIFGAWGIIDPNWPEKYLSGVLLTIVTIIDIYLILSSLFILLCLSCKRHRHPILALVGEMYGWLFIAAAALAISIIYAASFYDKLDSLWLLGTWSMVWAGMSIAAGLRSYSLFIFYKKLIK